MDFTHDSLRLIDFVTYYFMAEDPADSEQSEKKYKIIFTDVRC